MKRVKMNDLVMLSHLRNDSRTPLTIISKKTGIPVSTLFDRLKAGKDQLISKNTCLLDFTKLGYETRASILLKVEYAERERLAVHLGRNDAVNNLFRLGQEYDFLVEAIFKTIKESQEFIERLEKDFGVKDARIHFIVDELARERFLTDSALLPS